jgi:monovalent cation/proton antiporter MnhG/PhaG subunit
VILSLLTAGLLLIGTAAVLLACVAAVVLSDPYARLHGLSFAAIAGSSAIAAAVLLEWPSAEAAIKTALVWLLSLAGNPLLSHAMARAIRAHEMSEGRS